MNLFGYFFAVVLWLVYMYVSIECKSTRRPPEQLHIHHASLLQCFFAKPFINMTKEIVKDVQMKLDQANSIQEKYKHTLAYELGTLAAGIQETFEHMLEIYRTYSNFHDFQNRTYNLTVTMNAYHIIQGDYNKIRLEKQLFRQVKDKFEAKRQANLNKMKGLGIDAKRLPKGKPDPKSAKFMKEQLTKARRYGMGANGLPCQITTAAATVRGLWRPAPVQYINLT